MCLRQRGFWTLLSVVVILGLLASSAGAAPPNRTSSIIVDGQPLHFLQRPLGQGDQALVPFRTVFRALGATVRWDGANRTAVAEWEGSIIRFPMQARWAELDGERYQLPVASRLVTGSSYVPVMFLTDAMGLMVHWEQGRLVIQRPSNPGLAYRIIVDQAAGRLGLEVTNPGRVPVTVTFGSSKTHDFIIRSGGDRVWQASHGQAYLTVIQTLTLGRGESRTYWSAMPELKPGDYTVEAYFGDQARPVGRQGFTVAPPQLPQALRYRVVVDLQNDRVGLAVTNPTNQRIIITLPTSQTHDFVVKRGQAVVWRASADRVYLPQETAVVLASGQSRTFWSDLPPLPAGDYLVEGYFANSTAPLARAAFSVPAPAIELKYWLLYDAAGRRLGLMVYNDSPVEALITFPTAQTHDFIVRQNGREVWQFSDGQAFLTVVTTQRLAAGAHQVYWSELPVLPPGTYQAEALFLGNGVARRVASVAITVSQRDPLDYRLSFQATSMLENGPRLALEVRNESDAHVQLPAQYGYRLLVKDTSGNLVPGVGFSQSVGTLQVGAQRYHYSYLHNLSRGSYVAEVQSNVTGVYRTVATVHFVMP